MVTIQDLRGELLLFDAKKSKIECTDKKRKPELLEKKDGAIPSPFLNSKPNIGKILVQEFAEITVGHKVDAP
jgi:hypothetical protein